MTDYNLPEPDDMPWALGLSKEDVQKLREDKKRLSEYGKQKIAEFMKNQTIIAKVSEEDYQKVLDAFEERKASIPENDEIEDILNIKLTEEKKEELDRQRKGENILRRYNNFYDTECSGMPTGGPIHMIHLQSLALDCMISAMRCEHLNEEYTHIAISDIEDLIERLNQLGNEYLEKNKAILEPKE